MIVLIEVSRDGSQDSANRGVERRCNLHTFSMDDALQMLSSVHLLSVERIHVFSGSFFVVYISTVVLCEIDNKHKLLT